MKPRSICVIDDDNIYQFVTKKMIELSGLFDNFIFFSNGQEALANLKNTEEFPDIILMDINMPQTDGWSLLEQFNNQISQKLSDTKIYIVSSSIANADLEKANEYPLIQGFISKPITVQKLQEIVMQLNT